MLEAYYDSLTGKCIRAIDHPAAPPQTVYLTFDDGPDALCTPRVLECLSANQAKATFFVIGHKARAQRGLLAKILDLGHAIGDHTIDHDTRHYFNSRVPMAQWLNLSRRNLQEIGVTPVGFRSPLGIKTPALNRVLLDQKRPLVLWNIRFFDTARGLTARMVEKKLAKIKAGDIVLLHDTHALERRAEFLSALSLLLEGLRQKGFVCAALSEDLIKRTYEFKYGKE